MIKYILLLTIVTGLLSCNKVGEDNDDSVQPITQEVIEQRTIIKNVYIEEDDYDEYDPYSSIDSESNVSYWYVYYNLNNEEQGFKIIEIDVPYFDISKAIVATKPNKEVGVYLGITFFKRVSFETYKAYKNK